MSTTHPLRLVIENFKSTFVKYTMDLLCKQIDSGQVEPHSNSTFEQKLNYVHGNLIKFIGIFVDALICFYNMESEIRGERDIKRDILFLTTYLFIWNGLPFQRLNFICISTGELFLRLALKLGV